MAAELCVAENLTDASYSVYVVHDMNIIYV